MAAAVDAVEAFKNMRQLISGNANACINNAHRQLARRLAQAQRHTAALVIILQAVIKQIEEYLLHQRRNTQQLQLAAAVILQHQLHAKPRRLILQACQRTLRHILQHKLLQHIMTQLIKLRQLNNIVYQTQKIMRLIIDFLQKALRILRLHKAAEHNLRIAQHRLQRRLQLMRNVRRELAAQLLRRCSCRHVHHQQHKTLIRNTAAVKLIVRAATVHNKAPFAIQLNLLQKRVHLLALVQIRNALAQNALLIHAHIFQRALIDRSNLPLRIQEQHALVHIVCQGLQLLLLALIAAHPALQLLLLQRKALHNRLQLRIYHRFHRRLFKIQLLQRLQHTAGNFAPSTSTASSTK